MYIPVPTCTYVRTPRSAARRFGARVVVRTRYAYKYACAAYVVHAWDTRALVKLPLGGTVHVPSSVCLPFACGVAAVAVAIPSRDRLPPVYSTE